MDAPGRPSATAEAGARGGLRSTRAVSESFIARHALSGTPTKLAQTSSGARPSAGSERRGHADADGPRGDDRGLQPAAADAFVLRHAGEGAHVPDVLGEHLEL